jgi:hypothetical protein
MGTGDFEAFSTALMERHVNPVTRTLSTVGDVFWLVSVPAGVATRSLRVFGALFFVGTAVATGAHVFQPGTVKDEVAAVLRHPVWATRAEFARVFRR